MTKIWMAMLLVVAGGCASGGGDTGGAPSTRPSPAAANPVSASTAGKVHAECLVCKKNADMACIDVEVEKGTPQCVFDGKTYHFCSEECRKDFLKNPQR